METENATPWINGYYKSRNMTMNIFVVEGGSAIMEHVAAPQSAPVDPSKKGEWIFGKFGKAHPDVAKKTGKEHNDVQVSLYGGAWKIEGVVSDDGKAITFWGLTNELDAFELITEEEYLAIKDAGDPVDAPPCHYKIQPENVGKLLFISGPPGTGKSTSGQVLSKIAGYVYYEADCFAQHVNPFIPPEAKEPSLAQMGQNPLKGVSQERLDTVDSCIGQFMAMIEGKEYDVKQLERFYSAMCKDIAAQRKRIGGDWVVAQAVTTRALRDHIKAELGPDLIFVVLEMTKEDQLKRVHARHGDDSDTGSNAIELLAKMHDLYEPVTSDEQNAISVAVTVGVSREDVAECILKAVQGY